MTKDNCRIGYQKCQAWILKVLPILYTLIILDGPEIGPVPGLVDWEIIQKKMPWGVLILIGGSFALADAAKVILIFIMLDYIQFFSLFFYQKYTLYPWRLQANLFMGDKRTFATDLCNELNQHEHWEKKRKQTPTGLVTTPGEKNHWLAITTQVS